MSDERADFERLFRENYDAVFRFVARRTPPDAVQDIVAETFLAAWRRHRELRGDALPWLLGVARRVSANHLRGDARRRALDDRLSAQRFESSCSDPERGSHISLALSRLSERDREALMLVAWDGLEHRAAATVMGCSTTAFTVRVHRARRKLKAALTADGHTTITIEGQARSTS
jgi:RNA polymerase sigma-70 factor (ECF subfamily)